MIVIGAGAAGMMAAIAAADAGSQVCLLEKNEKPGKKLFITGKGRCNVTNAGDMETLFANVCSNAKFLYSAFYEYDNRKVMELIEQAGCPLKVERGDRVFPVSDHSSDIIAAFAAMLKKRRVEVRLHTEVKELLTEPVLPEPEQGMEAGCGRPALAAGLSVPAGGGQSVPAEGELSVLAEGGQSVPAEGGLQSPDRKNKRRKKGKKQGYLRQISGVLLADGETLYADRVIICTGGLSYPSTGSTGDGYRFAESAGHRITETSPSLVPLETAESWCRDLMGLSLKNVTVRLYFQGKAVYEELGEMLFTHFGVSGPLILSASSIYAAYQDKSKENRQMRLTIDLKPALDPEQLDKRLWRDFEENKNRQFKNALGGLFPARLIPVMLALSGIDPEKKVHEITRAERRSFGELIKALPLTVTGTRSYAEAVITRGGISVREVNPSTMESRIARGLYFAGEVLDLDARTGGFNLQIAWSTGYLAGSQAGNGVYKSYDK